MQKACTSRCLSASTPHFQRPHWRTLPSPLSIPSTPIVCHQFACHEASQRALMIKDPPADSGDSRDAGSFLGQEEPLEEEMATHSSILAWRIPWTEEPGGQWSKRHWVAEESDMTLGLICSIPWFPRVFIEPLCYAHLGACVSVSLLTTTLALSSRLLKCGRCWSRVSDAHLQWGT